MLRCPALPASDICIHEKSTWTDCKVNKTMRLRQWLLLCAGWTVLSCARHHNVCPQSIVSTFSKAAPRDPAACAKVCADRGCTYQCAPIMNERGVHMLQLTPYAATKDACLALRLHVEYRDAGALPSDLQDPAQRCADQACSRTQAKDVLIEY